MSDSSQPKVSSTTSSSIDDLLKELTIDLSGTGVLSDQVTYTSGSYNNIISYDTSGISTITLLPSISNGTTYSTTSMSGTDTISITGIDNYSAFNVPVEWVDCLPPFSRVQDMCEKYPGLKIAFENFKVFYEMVKDDYDNPTPKK